MRAAVVLVCTGALASALACESSVRVGELAASPDAGPTEPATIPPGAAPDAGPASLTWKLHGPSVPCSIHAMSEERSDALFLGCNGGRVYRFDGVRADMSLELEDTRLVSLLWASPGGHVFAGAMSGYGAAATTDLHHFDGTLWSKLPIPAERITSLTGTSPTDVWFTTPSTIRRWDGARATVSFTATTGELRACTFATATEGYCTGTKGLGVRWDGASWTPLAGAPWSASAEVFGVELDTFEATPTFFWGEPASGPHGEDAEVHAATWKGGAFRVAAAHVPSFTRSTTPRRRTGRASVSGRSYFLLSLAEQYGQALVFDPRADAFRELCAPALAFSAGTAKTRVGGYDGLLATLVGSGADQLALTSEARGFEPRDLSVATDGATWARVEDTAVCGSVTDRLVRFEDGAWRDVAGPEPVQSGRALAALGFEGAYTLTVADGILGEYRSGAWSERGAFEGAWSLWAKRPDDVWIGGYDDGVAHFDGKSLTTVLPSRKGRQITQVVADASGVVWMVALGDTQADTNVHAYRLADGKREEWDLGIESYGTHVSAIDRDHAWLSGEPAKAWNGAGWTSLPFDASNVWARSKGEVYFTFGGDVFRWNGVTRERVYRGFIPITAIDGSPGRAMAIGPGGLTLELGAFPPPTK